MFSVLADVGMNLLNNVFANDRQEDSQSFTADQGAITRQFNADQALEQRNWEERMSNTRYQRGVKDLEAAGLNPMLAYMNSASSHGAGHAASANAGASGIASPGGSNSVAAGMQSASQVEVNQALADRTKAEADEIRARTPRHEADIDEIRARTPTYGVRMDEMRQNIEESKRRMEELLERMKLQGSSAAHMDQQVVNLRAQLPQIEAQTKQLVALAKLNQGQLIQALTQAGVNKEHAGEIAQRVRQDIPNLEARAIELENIARKLAQPGQMNTEAAQDSFVGQVGAYLRALIPLNSVIGAIPMGRQTSSGRIRDDRQDWKHPGRRSQ